VRVTGLKFTAPQDAAPDAGLLRFCQTERQQEIISAIIDIGNVAHAARHLKIDERGVRRVLASVRARAAAQGHAPEFGMTEQVPDGFKLKGRSVLRKLDPVTGQRVEVLSWDKTSADDERRAEMLREAFAAISEDVPRVGPIDPPAETADHLCNVFTLTDCHVGMMAWRKEGGADWDLAIAERTLIGAFEQMVERSPSATSCVVNQLGDFLHWDGLLPVTPGHGHVLDADGRFSKMVRTAIRILRRVIDMALARHSTVFVVMAEGNHDLASSVWLRIMFAALYENEPRVRVIDSELPYYVHVHGETMLAFHHGHLKKNDGLPLLFAAQYPREWGATTKRYAHTGHRHHEEIKEHSGMKVTQHSTLAARDAYAARGGWHSDRQATAYTYHSRWGQVGSVTVSPEMVA
jgi:hypothetical protein